MINLWDSLLSGIIAGFGMFVVSAVFGMLVFKLTKPWLTKTISEIWAEVKSAGVIEIKLDGKDKKRKK